ncbi:hypothetical protein Q4493_06585 [Colwellia sp. 1_MG-2023]|uniref:hypothetical protein n=1 Tax=Colwellia sp. 1_MG-2023 TaxID=3062649 RepID=UPI0026E3D8D0|nr:hypothetical protein [Colwellia sp. 1_MG-2023]MDO6445444.1 hypothetical protein [Colwellia sp. 1_MG-2023]
MIIKSMSRKHRTFSQLYHYMKDGSSRSSKYDYFSHNIYSRKDQDIINEFVANSRKVKARKNGNYLFHEVIAITKSKQLTLEQEKERLFDIVRNYVDMRCKNNLVAGYMHDEKDINVHFHLMISSNELDAFKNQRLTKFEFDKAKKQLERYVIEKYPELEQDIIMNAKAEQRKSRESNKAAEVKRKGGRLEKKEHMVKTLNNIFANSPTMNEYFTQLEKQNIEMYNRGSAIGFINKTDGKKYRLKTLALEEQFKQVDSLLQQGDKAKQQTKVDESEKQQKNDKQETRSDADSIKEKAVEQNKADIKKARNAQQKSANAKSKNKDKGFER